MEAKVGHYAFIAGVILAIIAGVLTNLIAANIVTLVLVVLGLIVGLMNVTAKETTSFLIAAAALMIAGSANLNVIWMVGTYVDAIVKNIAVFVAPAAIVVAIKAVKALASD